jgi:hypothetical protein
MRRYPGRSQRLFEAPPPDLTPRRARPPADSLLAPEYGGAGFVATYTVEVATWSVVGIEAVARAFIGAVPRAVIYALRPHDLARRLAGHPSVAPGVAAGGAVPLAVGRTFGAFRALALTPNEAVLTPDAWLLNLHVSLRLENDWTHRWLAVTTVARPCGLGGIVALGPFARLHARIMPAIVRDVARAIDTPKPTPPGSRLRGLP